MILDEAALARWGERIGRTVARPAVFALRGELGAGKSVLARAIARGAGVTGPMPSPTFNLLVRYDADGGGRVTHIDLFRLERPDEVWELGWAELGQGGEVVLIEWPERAQSLLPAERWDIRLSFTDDPLLREVSVEPRGGAPELPGPDDD